MKRLGAFLRNRDANVAMMFAISLIPVTIAAGAGLDLTRAMIVKSNLTEALDAAALSVAATSGLTPAQMTVQAQNYFNANYKADANYGTPVSVTVTPGTQQVTVSTSVPMPTTLMGVAGIHTVNVTASSTVVWGQNKLWVSLVLDNTGSMTQADGTGTTKMSALKTATHQLLTLLQNASATAGDVRVALIPFSKDVNVGTANAGATWIDWTDWEAAPPSSTPSSSVGPGSNCPYSWNVNGFACAPDADNDPSCTNSFWGSDCVSKVPSSGLICPSQAQANASTGKGGHYYNGCYNSVHSQTQTTTKVDTTPITIKQNCSQTGSSNPGPVTCTNKSGYPSNGTTNSNTTTATTNGYTGDSGPATTTNTTTDSTADGTKTCTGSGASKVCTWTRTILQTKTDTTVTKVGTGSWNHTWVANSRTTWGGCVMDRTQSYDTNATAPTSSSTRFPAENSVNCLSSVIVPIGYNWSDLSTKVDAMAAAGTTNQTIGLAWGMHALSSSEPLSAPTLPANTKQYIIIVSDGLNTQNRWSGDGLNQETDVDARMALACTSAKASGYTIYAIFVDLGGTQGNSTVLQNCASDSGKYFDLTTSGAIITTLNAIGQSITNLRVAQ
ncbi:MAG: TadE/TadG family type IV pilus assembly protein [Rhizomicrobium sp.]